jgi:nitrite reductase/ring-hydroxylating ferredoxin subunit/uncharacterized membrane protein
MSSIARALESLVVRIERATALDPVADKIAAVGERLFPNGPIKDAASGTPAGHPLHPALVAVPMGSWLAATVLDLTTGSGSRRAAQRLVGFGALAALPAAATGASDWIETAGAERRVGLVHAGLNYAAIAMYARSWAVRRRGKHLAGTSWALAGGATIAASGWLGGHMTYALGVGVDTTAFQKYPSSWTDVAAADTVVPGIPTYAEADGVPVLLARIDGQVIALADRCTHRGAPLHEGKIENGCIVCPWHDSRFRLSDGSVVQGPATRPQPDFEVRVVAGRVEIRRPDEVRSLRANPVGT